MSNEAVGGSVVKWFYMNHICECSIRAIYYSNNAVLERHILQKNVSKCDKG